MPTRPPLNEDFPEFGAVFLNAIGIQPKHGCAAAKLAGNLGDQIWIFDRRGIQADLFRPGLDQPGGIVQRANPPAHGQRHEHVVHHLLDQFRHDLPAFVRGGDVVKHQLIRPIVLISPGLLDRIAGIDVIEKLDPFDDPATIDIEAGDDAF